MSRNVVYIYIYIYSEGLPNEYKLLLNEFDKADIKSHNHKTSI